MVQFIACEAGYPWANTLKVLKPARLNLIGTVLPVLATFMAGGLAIGEKKPVNEYAVTV